MDTDLPKNISNTAEEAPLAEKGMGVGKKKEKKIKQERSIIQGEDFVPKTK